MNKQVHKKETRLLRLPDVMALTSLRKSQLYALAKSGQFPQPLKLSERCSAWSEMSVRAWIAERIAAAEQSRKSGKAGA
ncbi:MAG: AlpA family phage regulatory protein [Proteobacteria bacterium]|nr:AlpA family phage regulatory protein [Pseudomonadota bacterium]